MGPDMDITWGTGRVSGREAEKLCPRPWLARGGRMLLLTLEYHT